MAGAGDSGQLGTGRYDKEVCLTRVGHDNVADVSCGMFHTLFATIDGRVYAMGGNKFG